MSSQQGAAGGAAGKAAATGPAVPEWVWPLAIVVLLGIFFFPVLGGGRVFSSPDAQAPQGFAVYAENLRNAGGDYPLWNPFIFCGMPSFSSLAYNPGVYFPDFPLGWIGGFGGPMLWLLLYYAVGAVALYLFLRDRGAAPWPAALGGLVFVLTPNLIAVGGHGHGSQLVCSGWLPVVLLFLHRYLARGGLHWLGLLALAIGCQLLRAHIQIAYYTWMTVGIYLVFYLLARRRGTDQFTTPIARGLGGTALALLLGMALAAVLVLPVMSYTPQSIRGAGAAGGVGLDYATGWSMSLLELVTLVVPGALGFGGQTYWGTMPFTDYPNAYMGILPLFFMGLGLWLTRGRGMGVFVALGLVGIVIALGKNLLVYELLYDYLPFWKKFRVPVMILLLTHLAGASMMALGLTALLAARRGDHGDARRGDGAGAARRLARLLRWKGIGGLVLLLIVLLGSGGLRTWYKERFVRNPRIAAYVSRGQLGRSDAFALGDEAAGRAHRDAAKSLALITLAAAGGALLLRRRVAPEIYLGGLTVLLAFDLVPIDRQILAPVTQPRSVLEQVSEPDATTRFLAQQGPAPFRVFPLEEFGQNRFATFGIASVGGYHAAKPAAYQQFMTAAGVDNSRIFSSESGWRLLDFLNVRYLITRQQVPESERIRLAHQGDWRVYENTGVAPRAFLVGQIEVVEPGPPTLARLVAPEFDPLETALVEADPGPLMGVGETGTVHFTRHDLNQLTLEVDANGPTLLVLSEGYDPGWCAWVDGVEQPVLRVNHAFRGVQIAAGQHRVEMVFIDRSLRVGLGISLVAAVLIVGLLLLGGWRVRRGAAAVEPG